MHLSIMLPFLLPMVAVVFFSVRAQAEHHSLVNSKNATSSSPHASWWRSRTDATNFTTRRTTTRMTTPETRFNNTWNVLSLEGVEKPYNLTQKRERADNLLPTFNRLGGGCGQFVASVTRRIIDGNKKLQDQKYDTENSVEMLGVYKSLEDLKKMEDYEKIVQFVFGKKSDGSYLYVVNTDLTVSDGGVDHAWVILRRVHLGLSRFLVSMGYVGTGFEAGYSGGSKVPWPIYNDSAMKSFFTEIMSLGIAGKGFNHTAYFDVFHMKHPEKNGTVTGCSIQANVYGPMEAFS
mmetsp:Transcript_12504/g.22718  ORF Transcript_12504/g.22718 Transcript_12504/m.22718 type:complete len:291 (+) Transcript_12504:78-950(+)